jgi:ComF family protein
MDDYIKTKATFMSERKENVIQDSIDFFYPRNCVACECVLNAYEEDICLDCKNELPRTDFHLHPNNPVFKIFWARLPLVSATAYFYFSKESRVQKVLHHIKYYGYKELGHEVGKWFGNDLSKNPELTESLDYIIPIPLHPKKLKTRGYNQSEVLAAGMAESMNKQLESENLTRNIYTSTQTRKSRYKRWENVKDIFKIHNTKKFENKHILLVDDVITTGSTIEACCLTLMQCKNIKISVASIAYASL